jgi:putative tryptophan/tyrosine transport system substrate-binding protein
LPLITDLREGKDDRLHQLAAEQVRLKVDIIVATASAATAKDATNTIPIVFVASADPVASGIVVSWRGRAEMLPG